ncbi:MAG: Lrp/AsnC family transcriptional regulator [Rhodospirillaceae bacterium]|jgi:Lrp/AsnC family transcriptional regulator, leucine-responsive regulatory protein|nr:Lrp/AsnC family transcriptional regulator [Rhodospirillaceae bacterium]MBT6140110.1 Lrp/AsnC family transcriptional regulator [Rhodospirillaceae bacterium]
MSGIDAIDRRILMALQEDGRVTNADLAELVNLSPSACLRRVRQLEEEGVIDRYVMLLNQHAIGRATNVFVDIALDSQSELNLDAFERAVEACPDVMECHLMAGDFDYQLRLAADGPEGYERIHRTQLSRLPGVARLRTNFSLRTVFRRTAFPIPSRDGEQS